MSQEIDKMDKPLPFWGIALIPIYVGGMFAVILLPISGDWLWLEAWLFIISFAILMGLSYFLINKKNPRVLRNRMKTKKEGLSTKTKKAAGSDRWIMPILGIGFFGAIFLPPFDYRYGWTTIPFVVEMIALVVMNIGLLIMDVAMVQNAYASKILDINEGQKLIDTGLYGKVRHPLYTGAIIMIFNLPIALGSWISIIPALIGVLSLFIRIKYEEEMLLKGMDGYEEYRTRVKYKLFPGIY
ncbi:MAG: methyltransferase family protein [Promethearchaeota archaeon]